MRSFNDFYWHDSVIKNIIIDRTNPGRNDTIRFEIDFVDEGLIDIIFDGVRWANLSLNFGIIVPENILHAYVTERTDNALIDLYKKGKGMLDNIILDCYEIELNSTGGKIKIIAEGFTFYKKP